MENSKEKNSKNNSKSIKEKRKLSKSGVKLIISYYTKSNSAKFYALVIALLSILVGILSVYVPQEVRKLLTEYLGHSSVDEIFWFSAQILMWVLVSIVLIIVSSKIATTVTSKVTSTIRRDAYNRFLNSDHYYYDSTDSGSTLSKISRDVEKTATIGLATIKQILTGIVTLFYGVYYIISISWKLSLTAMILILIFPIFFGTLGAMFRKREQQFVKENAKGTQHLNVSIMGIKLIKSFSTEQIESDKFEKNNEKYHENLSKKMFLQSLMQQMGTQIFTIVQIGILFVGALLVHNKELNLGDIISFYLFVTMALQPIIALFFIQVTMIEGSTAMESVNELLTAPISVDMNKDSKLSDFKGNLVFKDVNFSYNDEKPYQLNNFNYEFKNGKKYAIVGPSGSGKTTLINLIAKFYNTTNGEILINNTNLNDFNVSKLRKNIGIVQQEVFIFPGTLKENIAYGKTNVTDDDVISSAKKANLHDEIMKFEDGYDTYIGENGVKLSGGQRQRVSIARMFLKDPQLLILDEATSALDTITEQKIQDAFEKLMQNRTSITIAHRLTTITNSDKILVLENGRLIMDGTHNELLEKQGLYNDLYKAMMKNSK